MKIKTIMLVILLAAGVSNDAIAGIGITYEQAMRYFGDDFRMSKSTPVDGRDRYMGTSKNGMAVLEIIGQRNDLSQASLIVGLPNDSPAIVVHNAAMLLRFLKNTVPGWAGSSAWATSTLKKIAKSDGKVSIVKGGIIITMQY